VAHRRLELSTQTLTLVRRRPLRLGALTVISIATLATFFASFAQADIRFYKINKKGQQSELMFVRGDDDPGCHNFSQQRNIFRVAQVGFKRCALFREKDCATDSVIEVRWSGKAKTPNKKRPTTKITPGSMWMVRAVDPDAEVRSWQCEN
jgi:hypothetical protein